MRSYRDIIDLPQMTFGGSGLTLIAAEQIQRSGYLIEFDGRHVDVIVSINLKFVWGYKNSYLIRNGEKKVYQT